MECKTLSEIRTYKEVHFNERSSIQKIHCKGTWLYDDAPVVKCTIPTELNLTINKLKWDNNEKWQKQLFDVF